MPLVVGDAVHTAQDLAARTARWVVDKVAEREGGPADLVAITHPASWGEHKRDLLAGALREAGLSATTFLPEPQAAAVAYAAKERVEPGGAVAVYDLGGGTFDAAVVRKTASGFELPGRPEGIEALGGVDFDDRVFDHARAGLGAAFDELDPEDADVVSAVARLRRECVEAKEALSSDTEVTIPVMLPALRTNVRLTRREFESMIRSSLDHTVAALRRTLESASLAPDDLQAVLLVGGSSRIPLVAQMVSEDLGRPVAVDTDPKTSIAVGAVLAIAPRKEPARAKPVPGGTENAAAAAAMTSKLGRRGAPVAGAAAAGAAGAAAAGTAVGGAAPRTGSPTGDDSSGLIDLRGRTTAPPTGPARTGPPSGAVPAGPRIGPPSGRMPAVGPPSARFPSAGPGSGRLPVAPSGRFPAAPGRPPSGAFPTVRDDAVTTVAAGAAAPARPPVATGDGRWDRPADTSAPAGRSRTRLLVVAGTAAVLVAALATGGVVYARSASVSATVVPVVAPTSAVVPPAPVVPPEAALVDDSAGSGAASSGSGSGGGSAGSGSGSSSGGSSAGGHQGSGSTSRKTTAPRTTDPTPTTKPTDQSDSGENGS